MMPQRYLFAGGTHGHKNGPFQTFRLMKTGLAIEPKRRAGKSTSGITRMAKKQTDKGDSIRAVERAIDLLQALNRRPLSTLHDLHRDTGLPKPSIVRLLRTLEAKGLAAPSSSYGTYQLLGRVKSLASGFHHEPRIVEVAEDLMIEFTRREGWPLSLALFDVNAMVVRACTIRFTALSLEHAAINRRLSLLVHAMGRAYLAFSADKEQAILRSILRGAPSPDCDRSKDDVAVDTLIASVRRQGYALRDPAENPRSSTIAVPVFEGGRVVATLGFTWIAAAMTAEEAASRHVRRLNELARRISRELDADPVGAPPPSMAVRASAFEWAHSTETPASAGRH